MNELDVESLQASNSWRNTHIFDAVKQPQEEKQSHAAYSTRKAGALASLDMFLQWRVLISLFLRSPMAAFLKNLHARSVC